MIRIGETRCSQRSRSSMRKAAGPWRTLLNPCILSDASYPGLAPPSER